MPIPFGVVAFFQLRKKVGEWEVEGLPIDRGAQENLPLEATSSG
jgi:hypothetical protein